mgnify:FL=1
MATSSQGKVDDVVPSPHRLPAAVRLSDLIAAMESFSVSIARSVGFLNATFRDGSQSATCMESIFNSPQFCASDGVPGLHVRDHNASDVSDVVFELITEISRMIRAFHLGLTIIRGSDWMRIYPRT